jgi:two-component system sensor histidine kinase MprB
VSLRTKLVLALVGCTALASIAVGTLSYGATALRLREEVDRSLGEATQELFAARRGPSTPRLLLERAERGAGEVDLQLIDAEGSALSGVGGALLPISEADRRVAASDVRGERLLRTVDFDGTPTRMLTTAAGSGNGAVQAARSLEEPQRVLSALRSRILMVTAGVAGAAALAGWLIARQVTARLTRVTDAAERVAATGDLGVAVPVDGADEAARLGSAFNEMVGALARSREDQQRLVQDAGHELRTPMTSVRTNLYTLRGYDSLSTSERARVLADLESETEELSRLIDEVVEVATDRRGDEPAMPVDLVALVQRVARRATARTGRAIEVRAEPTTVQGRPAALRRAVGNLLENAAKFDSSGSPIEVHVANGTVEVLDRGPGFPEADLPHVFQRFYRSTAARATPGSGLGLSIVAEIATGHGGTVWARNRPGGGASVGFALPAA